MTYVLFLDDSREVVDVIWVRFFRDIVVVRDYSEFVSYITHVSLQYFLNF